MPSSNAQVSRIPPKASAARQRSDASQRIARLSLHLAQVTERDFLTEYALAACEAIGADIFLIGRLNPYSNLMRSIRFVSEGKLVDDGVTYSLDGTPCARATDTGACVYKDNVADLFPQDRMLKELGLRGYAGAPLHASDGGVLGVAVALTKAPIEDERLPLRVLDLFKDRVANAVETAEIIERHDWAIANATDGVWDWDMVTGGAIVSDNLKTLLGKGARDVLDFSKIENAIHPEDRPRHREALNGHLKNGAPYNLKLRLRDRSGEYRWHHSRGKAMRNDAGRPVRMIGCFSDIHDLVVDAKTT